MYMREMDGIIFLRYLDNFNIKELLHEYLQLEVLYLGTGVFHVYL